jgi:hypothetical protein
MGDSEEGMDDEESDMGDDEESDMGDEEESHEDMGGDEEDLDSDDLDHSDEDMENDMPLGRRSKPHSEDYFSDEA